MNIVIGLVIAGFIYYCYIKIRVHNELRSERQEALNLVISEERKATLDRIESLIVDLRNELLHEKMIDQERLLHADKKIFGKIEKIEALLTKDMSDEELECYRDQNYE